MARNPKYEFRESIYAQDLVQIMKAGSGPYTRKMLAQELSKLYPQMYWQDLMNEVSSAIQLDRWSQANRFRAVKKGWYDLA